MKKLIGIFLLLIMGTGLRAQEVIFVRDSVKIHFRQDYSTLEPKLRSNQEALNRIADSLLLNNADSIYKLRSIHIVGGASPEGSVIRNKRLSEKRAGKLFDYLSRYGELPDSLTTFSYLGRDWKGLIRLVENDPDVPYREETLDFLRDIVNRCADGEKEEDNNVGRLSRLRGGAPYKYMYNKLFPELRASQVILHYEKVENTGAMAMMPCRDTVMIHDTIHVVDTIYIDPPCRPFYMAAKTNMLYDLAAVPNIGVEFYLGKRWSVAANWMYAWWKTDRCHWYWRTYGGDLSVRKWLGERSKEKPLQGHHLGVYGQMVTYDFETGGRGYLGDKWSYAAGLEYGYSLPIAYRLNLDFTIGIGYMGGKYKEYLPIDDHYVWQVTKQRHWIGPTKAEISLVWLIGCGNFNKDKEKNREKGGRR